MTIAIAHVCADPSPTELSDAMTKAGTWPAILVEHEGALWVSVNAVQRVLHWRYNATAARNQVRQTAEHYGAGFVEADGDVLLPKSDALRFFAIDGRLSFVNEEVRTHFPGAQRLDLRPPEQRKYSPTAERLLNTMVEDVIAENERLQAEVEALRKQLADKPEDPVDRVTYAADGLSVDQVVEAAADLLKSVWTEWAYYLEIPPMFRSDLAGWLYKAAEAMRKEISADEEVVP